jgi:hypothetical protein
MELEIAKQNFGILQELKEHQQLIVNIKTNQITVDERYLLKGLRRTYSRDSRRQLIKPIRMTFETLFNSDFCDSDEIHKTLLKLRKTFLITYPKFTDLQKEISSLMYENQKTIKVVSVDDPDDASPGCCCGLTLKTRFKKIFSKIKKN